MSVDERDLDQLCINTIRTLSMDAVQAAHSGHPGTPMAMAPVVYTLWQNFLRFDPEDPIWLVVPTMSSRGAVLLKVTELRPMGSFT